MQQPAVIGWQAKQRQVELVIERSFKGRELLRRMKGWVKVDADQAIDIIQQHAKLKVLDDCDLVVETRNQAEIAAVAQKPAEAWVRKPGWSRLPNPC